jgi:hypothetical protein
LFPPDPGKVDVDLLGSRLQAHWNPRIGPDRERSGVLRFAKGALEGLFREDERLDVKRSNGLIELSRP